MAHTGIGRRKSGPLATFLFSGPSGVGKTEVAKRLAEFLFGDQTAMIRLDMSEYAEEHSISRLVGSPPGYVGYEEEDQLTRQLRTQPYSVVLFNECEKAHPHIFDLFLQLFDDGRITDAKGRLIDARNGIFILTPNLVNDNSDHRATQEKLKSFFRIELLNRIDEVIVSAR